MKKGQDVSRLGPFQNRAFRFAPLVAAATTLIFVEWPIALYLLLGSAIAAFALVGMLHVISAVRQASGAPPQ